MSEIKELVKKLREAVRLLSRPNGEWDSHGYERNLIKTAADALEAQEKEIETWRKFGQDILGDLESRKPRLLSPWEVALDRRIREISTESDGKNERE